MGLFLELMLFPFLACLVLTGMHVYLGVHVIARKVIFVDLALATIAALGALAGALLGYDVHHDTWVIKGFSLAFTFLGAAMFALTRGRRERVPHEAIIGISYAVALAAMILGSSKLPHGAEEVRDLQAGSILWVSGSTVGLTAGLYAVIGAIHYRYRRQFFGLSMDPERARAEGLNVRLWDFFFYVSFGFVVTSSVSIAGILLVFAYLVIPAVIGVLFAQRTSARLTIGWGVGACVSAIGISISYWADFPSGPVIVVSLGLALALAGILRFLLDQPSIGRGLMQVALGLTALLAMGIGALALRKEEAHDLAHIMQSGDRSEQLSVLRQLEGQSELWDQVLPALPDLVASSSVEIKLGLLSSISKSKRQDLLPIAQSLLGDADDFVRQEALGTVVNLGLEASVEALFGAASSEPDEFLRIEIAEALLEAKDLRGVPILLEILDTGEAKRARQEACVHLHAYIPISRTYHADPDYEGHAREMQEYRDWWAKHGSQ